MEKKMYTDGVLQKPKKLKKVKRLKHKSAKHQEKNLDPFYLINESVRTAREISSTLCSSVPSDHDPIMMVNDIEYAKCHDTSVQPDIDDILGLLHSSRRSSPSPFIECTLTTTTPTKEEKEKEKELSLQDETSGVQITTRDIETTTDMRRITSNEGSENTSILILSTNSLSLTGDELQDPEISFDNGADSSIILGTDEECDEDLLFVADENITINITPDDSDKKNSLLEGKQVTELNPESENVCEKSRSPDIVLVPPIIGIPLKKNENYLQGNIVESLHQCLSSPHDKKNNEKSPDVPQQQQQVSLEAEKLIFTSTESVKIPAEKRPSAKRDLHPSRSLEHYVQEGRAKRQLQEEIAEQQRQRELQEIRFTPQVSSYAAQRVSRTVSEYIYASQQWEEQRQAHVKKVAARLEDAAREEYAACVKLNPTSRQIVIEMMAQKRRVSVMEGVQQHAAAREMRMRELKEKYTPTFRPVITQAAQRQKRGTGNHNMYMREKEKNTSHQGESEKALYVESKYQSKKRSTTAIREHVEAMLARDAARRAKSQQRAENIRREEEERMRRVKPHVNPHSEELAERHRQRQRTKEKEEKLAAAESKRRSASRHIQQQGVMHKNNLSPDIKEEEQDQQTIPINRKLAYSSSGTRGNSRVRSSCSSKQQQQQHSKTPLLSPEFEERNTRLLQKRQLRAESRRRELDEEFAQTCTFRPQTNPVSRRMADAHYSYTESNSHSIRRPSAAATAAAATTNTTNTNTTSTSPPIWVSNNIEDDFEWAECVRRATYSVKNSDTSSRGCTNAQEGHNDINYHHGNNNNNNKNDNNGGDDLSSQIESLEAMLAQWKQLEAEFRV